MVATTLNPTPHDDNGVAGSTPIRPDTKGDRS